MASFKDCPSISNEDNDEDNSLHNLFVCEDYVEKSWYFGALKQTLLCSNMSSTDHDLTGQIVWPACVLLSWFIVANGNEFRDKVVLELGAGCGLSGFVAGNYCKKAILTDGNDIVVNLLERNKIHLGTKNVQVEKLLWGIKADIDRMVVNPNTAPDIIVGADVILWPQQVRSLLYTIRWLLSLKRSTSKCYISYIVRAHTTTELLIVTCSELGLDVTDIAVASFVPLDCHDFDTLEKRLLCFSIQSSVSDLELARDVSKEIEKSNATSAMPC